ncbi:MAG: lamin tail domain-containing protein, partial [Ardenticatenaceae bacterium]|nr:lamin tail domain-containing protein [Ardenticatenaceae bacterium]
TTGYLNNQIENGTVTLLLVDVFTGTVGTDLDTDDDGVFDLTPWSRIIDAIAIDDGGSGDLTYTSVYTNAILTRTYDGFSEIPGGASRIPNGVNTFSAGDWVRNDPDGAGLTGFTGTPIVGEAYNTPGAENQSVAVPMHTLVINEIDYNQPGTDAAEFIEIYNADSVAVEFKDYALKLVNGTDGIVYQSIPLPDVILSPGNYFVVCGNPALVLNCDLDVSPDTDLIQNGAPDAVALMLGNQMVDSLSYEGDSLSPYTEGTGTGLQDPSDTDDDYQGLSRIPDGQDTQQNNSDFAVHCVTPGLANDTAVAPCTPPENPPLLINEIDYDQPGGDTAEFVELFNAGDTPLDLSIFSLRLINGANDAIYQNFALPSLTLAAGDYFVVCGDAALTVNCDLDVSPDADLIQNGAPDAAAVMIGDRVIDAVSYEGDTAVPYLEGSGVGLIDTGVSDYMGISRWPNGMDTAVNNVDFSPRCITPGEANTSQTEPCPELGPTAVLHLQANPTSVLEPGGPVIFTVYITNTSTVTITINNLVDDMASDLNGQGTCSTGQVLAVNGSYTCHYTDEVNGAAGQSVTHLVTAVGQDAAGHTLNASQSVTVTINKRYQLFLPAIRHDRSDEPNNICSEAYSIKTDQTYSFLANDDKDWYQFDLPTKTNVTIRLTNFLPMDGQIVVYSGSNCSTLSTVGNDGSNSTTKTVNLVDAPPGGYYILIINEGTTNITTPYQLLVDTP